MMANPNKSGAFYRSLIAPIYQSVLLASLGLVSPALADFSLSPTTLTYSTTRYTSNSYPQAVTITGTGTANFAASSCPNVQGNQAVLMATSGNIRGAATTSTSVTAPGTAYLTWEAFSIFGLAPQTLTCTVAVTGTGGVCLGTCTITMSIQVLAQSTTVTYQTANGSCLLGNPGACTSSGNGAIADLDITTIPNMRPGGTFNMPNAPGTYVDPTFGTTIKSLTLPNIRASGGDVIVPSINSDKSLNLNISFAPYDGVCGFCGYLTDNNGVDQYRGAPYGNQGQMVWDNTDPHTYYYVTGLDLNLHKVVLNWPCASPPCSVAGVDWSDTVIWTDPASTGASAITNGGDGDLTPDGWWALSENGGTPSQVILINVGNVAQVYFANQPAYWGANAMGVRSTTASPGIDVISGKRYILVNSGGAQETAVYEWDAIGGLVYARLLPVLTRAYQSPGTTPYWGGPTGTDTICSADQDCLIVGHTAVLQIDGQQFFVGAQNSVGGPYTLPAALMKLNTGDNMLIPVESGGGMYVIDVFSSGTSSTDTHTGSARKQPVFIIATDSVPSPPSFGLAGVSNANPIVVTVIGGGFTGTNGQQWCLANVLGNTAANGCWTISAASAAGFTIPAIGNGTFTANSGGTYLNTTPDITTISHPEEYRVYDVSKLLSGHAATVHRVLQHRSWPMHSSLAPSGYYGQGHPSLSMDGTFGIMESNGGVPDNVSVFSFSTGVTIGCSISPSSLPNGTVSIAYPTTTFTNSGCTASTWSTTGTLPTGLAFNTGTGVLSGTPTVAGTYNFNVLYDTASNPFTVVIASGGATPTFTGVSGSKVLTGAKVIQ